MTDRETESIWTHMDGNAIGGRMKGERLAILPLVHARWDSWKNSHPNTMVLSPDTLFRDKYGPVSIGVFNPREAVFGDNRLAANDLVVGVEVGGQFKGYSLKTLRDVGGVINDTLAGQPIVVTYDETAQTGLAYSRLSDGLVLECEVSEINGFWLKDKETQSIWNQRGRASAGPLRGTLLEFVPSFISEWYGWSGYHPETMLFQSTLHKG